MTGTNGSHRQAAWGDEGNDRIVVQTPDDINGKLGEGDDTFLGGPGDDFIQGEADGSARPGPEQVEGFDRISSGGGSDEVVIGLPGSTTRDAIDLGEGDDVVEVRGTMSPEIGLQGGAGSDFLWPTPDATGHDWVVDNILETATMDGVVQFGWDSLEEFGLETFKADTLTFVGSDGPEWVGVGPELVAASLGGGDDGFAMSLSEFPTGRLPEISAGPGRDTFSGTSWHTATVDLDGDAAWGDTGSASDPVVLLDGFEDAKGWAEQVRLIGDAGDNVLDGTGCDVATTGGAGDDQLLGTWQSGEFPCVRTESRAFFSGGPGRDTLRGLPGPDRLVGGPGRDRLYGENGPDRLFGGAGYDTAVGDDGTDRCVAEVRRSCERR